MSNGEWQDRTDGNGAQSTMLTKSHIIILVAALVLGLVRFLLLRFTVWGGRVPVAGVLGFFDMCVMGLAHVLAMFGNAMLRGCGSLLLRDGVMIGCYLAVLPVQVLPAIYLNSRRERSKRFRFLMAYAILAVTANIVAAVCLLPGLAPSM